MTPPRPGTPAASLRRLLAGLFVAYLLFVVYGSLVPLRFQALPMDEALARFAATPMLDLGIASRADLVANLLLFVPLAFLAREMAVGERRGAGAFAVTLLLWAACAALAVGIEFTQVFFPARTVSQNDIAAEASGAAIGLLLHMARGAAIRRWLLGWWQAESGLPVATRALRGYLVLLALFAVMPLDLTLSPVEVYHKYKLGRLNLLPFADLPHDVAQAAYDVVADVLLWWPVGLLWRLAGRSVAQAAWRGALASAVLEGLQLFVFSRVTSSTDVITAALGCALGAALAPAGWRQRAAAAMAAGSAAAGSGAAPSLSGVGPRAAVPAGPWGVLTAAWAVAALAVFWFPFDFGLSRTTLALRWDDAMRVPFATYYGGSEFQALNELLRKTLVFLPGGLLWAARSAARPAARRRASYVAGAIGAALLALLVEGGQLALPDKVADLTDAVLEAAGAWVGLLLGARLFGTSRDPAPASMPASASVAADALGPQGAPARPAAGPWADAVLVTVLGVLLWLGARLPGVPYNVKELLPSGADGLLTGLGVAVVCAWLLALPLWLFDRLQRQRHRGGWLLAAIPLLGLPPGLVLLAVAPEESLQDILGAPVLGWPAGLELLGRYLALHAAAALAAIGAVWGVRTLAAGRSDGMLTRWLLVTLLWAVPVHAVVVVWADTDNLVELMRDGGGPLASVLLFIGLLALFTAASAVAVLVAGAARAGRRIALGCTAAAAWAAATLAFWQGTEPVLLKYGQVFSAAQFLLSADREHYAGGTALLLRWGAACIVLFGLAAWLQWPGWRRVRAGAARGVVPMAARPRQSRRAER